MSIASVEPDDFAGELLDSETFKLKNWFARFFKFCNIDKTVVPGELLFAQHLPAHPALRVITLRAAPNGALLPYESLLFEEKVAPTVLTPPLRVIWGKQ